MSNSLPASPGQHSVPASGQASIIRHADGSASMHLANDIVVEREANGCWRMQMPVIKRVEISDITAVRSHQINHLMSSTSHVIHFFGGGIFTIAYDDDGNFMSSESQHIVLSFTDDGVIRLERSIRADERSKACFGDKEL